MISLKQQFVLAAATVLLAACGGGGGGAASNPVVTLDNSAVQAAIQAAVNKPEDQKPFRWEVVPTPMTVSVAASKYESDLQVQVYRYTQEAIDNGTMGELVGSGTVGAAGGTVTLDLTADPEESVLVQVLDGPVKREYEGKPYRIVKVKELGGQAF